MSPTLLLERAASQCSPGDTYYVCTSNGFNGCCSASNVCELAGCPDGESTASSSTSTKAVAEAMTTASSTVSITTTTASTTPVSNAHNRSANTTIIVASICSILAILIFSGLAWLLLRRRQQRLKRRVAFETSTAFEKEYDLSRRSIDDEEGNAGEALTTRNGYEQAQQVPCTRATRDFADTSLEIEESGDLADQPLPDPEKTGLEAPPVDDHPALHPLPGQSPEIPHFTQQHSASPISPSTPATPIHSQQQKQHPAYHVHQLSQHPAFRTSPRQPASAFRSPQSNLQKQVVSPRQPTVSERSNSVSQSDVVSPFSPPTGPFSFLPSIRNNIRNSYQSLRPSSRSHSELPAGEVPRKFSQSKSDPSLLSRFNNSRAHQQSFSSHTRSDTTKTGTSTYSIPIGLGFEQPDNTIAETATKLRIQKFQPSRTSSKDTTTPRPKIIQTISSPQIVPEIPPAPMKATMNAREDHVLSWSSYSAGNLSGIGGPVSSTKSARRKQRQREIELGLAPGTHSKVGLAPGYTIEEGEAWSRAELPGCVPLGENGTPPMNVEYEIMRWSNLPRNTPAAQRSRPGTTYTDDCGTPMSVERSSWAMR